MLKDNKFDPQFEKIKDTVQLDATKKRNLYATILKDSTAQPMKKHKKIVPIVVLLFTIPLIAALFLLNDNTDNAKDKGFLNEPQDVEKPSETDPSDTIFNVDEYGSVDEGLVEQLILFLNQLQMDSGQTPIAILNTVKIENGVLLVDFNIDAYQVMNPSTAAAGYLMRHLNAIAFSNPAVNTIYYSIEGNVNNFTNFFGFVNEPMTRNNFLSYLSEPQKDCAVDEYVSLSGYTGKDFCAKFTNSVKVLEESLTISQNEKGEFIALGLLRNETAIPLGNVRIHLMLYDENKELLEEATATSPVHFIRFGEPAPFYIETATKFEEVASYEWHIQVEDAYFSREFRLYTYYELPFGEEMYEYTKREDPPYPYILQMGVENLGSPVNDIVAIVAVVNPEGHVVHLNEVGTNEMQVISMDEVVDFNELVIDHELAADAYMSFDKYIWLVEKQ